MEDGAAAGCVGVREFDPGAAEVKRMYVRPEVRGRGYGRTLLGAACEAARALGYRRVRLDTVPSMESAIRLYRTAGFREIPPYRHTPRPGALFFEREV
jgi:carbonic anhydrase